MKQYTTPIEQLFQELVSQDSSFASQKKEIVGLLERMTQHTPSVSKDPLFQQNLKSRLEQHLAYMNNLKSNPPQTNPRINRLARLISYGLPAVALGVIIFLTLPYHPTTAPIETTTHEYNTGIQEQGDTTLLSGAETQVTIIPSESVVNKTISADKVVTSSDVVESQHNKYSEQPQPKVQNSIEPIERSSKQGSENNPEFIPTAVFSSYSSLSDSGTTDMLGTSGGSALMLQNIFPEYKYLDSEYYSARYMLGYDLQNNITLKGEIIFVPCNKTFIFDNPSRLTIGPNLWSIDIISKDEDNISQKINFTIEDEENKTILFDGYKNICNQ